MPHLADPTHVWTFEDLQELPDDADLRRYEIVDGALVVSPSPSVDHELISAALRSELLAWVPAGHAVVGPLTEWTNEGSYRTPDLLVIPTTLFGQGRRLVMPAETLLVVEVVSPASRTTDRITKPAEYAAAGIGAYWRVETSPVELAAYTLASGGTAYTEQGRWGAGQMAEVTTPFPARIDLARLVPD